MATRYCEICKMNVQDCQWQDHKIGKKHRKNYKKNRYAEENGNGDGSHGSHYTIRIRAAPQDTTSVVFPVWDMGGTELGMLVVSPKVSWCEMAASWQSVTGTNLLPPEGTCTSTVATELCDEFLTAVAVG